MNDAPALTYDTALDYARSRALERGIRIYSPDVIVQPGERLTLETVLTHPDMFGLTTATPLQRAGCRASDGLPIGELWDDPEVQEAFGGTLPPEHAPLEFCMFSAIRCAKSLTAAAKIVQLSQEVDLSRTRPSDIVLIPCLSVDKAGVMQLFGHLKEALESKPALHHLLIGEPTAERIQIRHPSGRVITIRIRAMAKHGASVISTWCAGGFLDEASRMAGEFDGAAKNLEETRRALVGRLLDGAQIWYTGSPKVAAGPAYEMDREHWGKPSRKVVVIRAPGPALNPQHWTPERCEALKETDITAYKTDVLAQFADATEQMFAMATINRAMRANDNDGPPEYEGDDEDEREQSALDILPDELVSYTAAMDPATRSDRWTLVVVGRLMRTVLAGEKLVQRAVDAVVATRQWIPGIDPLDPEEVITKIGRVVARYRVSVVWTDQWNFDTLRVIARQQGFEIAQEDMQQERQVELYTRLRTRMQTGEVELSTDARVRQDLVRVRKHLTGSGQRIVLPRGENGHADFAPALVLATAYDLAAPRAKPLEHGTPEWEKAERAREKQAFADRVERERRERARRMGGSRTAREVSRLLRRVG